LELKRQQTPIFHPKLSQKYNKVEGYLKAYALFLILKTEIRPKSVLLAFNELNCKKALGMLPF
jgi:hypothetical protein